MEFTNEFTIPVGIDEAFAILTDLERVAPCMPGAALEEAEGDTYKGRVKVKVGPMSLTYHGTARLHDVDPDNHSARIEASGQEMRGGGTASADVHSSLVEKGGETVVTVVTDIRVTGRPAQFGRGVMADVGEKILDKFAACLADEVSRNEEAPEGADDSTAEAPAPAEAAESATESGPRRIAPVPPREEALDLFEVAGEATAKRLAPVLAVVAVVLLVWWLRRRD